MKRFLMAIFLAGCMVGDPTAGGGGAGGGGASGGGGAGSGVMTGSGSGDGGGSGGNVGSGAGTGSGTGSGTAMACTGAVYDPCTSDAQCTTAGATCKSFNGAGIEGCTVACTPGDDTTCPAQNGQPVTCNNMGVCKPAAANVCTR
jgi:hypothetical protein